MTSRERKRKVEPDTSLEVDAFGIKYRRLKKFEAEEDESGTWQEVWSSVHGQLRRVCANLVGVLGDGIGAARSILQGIGGAAKNSAAIPKALADRVSRSHTLADAAEDQRQQYYIDTSASTGKPAGDVSSEQMLEKLKELRDLGYCVDLIEHEDGSFTLVLKHFDPPASP